MSSERDEQPKAVLHRVPLPIARWMLRVSPRLGSLASIVAAAGLLLFGLLVRLPLDVVARTPLPPYITIYPLLPIIGFVAGFRVGLAVVVASLTLAWFFWIEPFGSFEFANFRSGLTVVIFAIAGPVAMGFGALARHALEQVAAHQATSDRNTREAVHRTKNLLVSVEAIVRSEARRTSDSRELVSRIGSTIGALSRAQDLLISSDGMSSSLAKIVEAGLAACASNPRLHVVGGPDILLPRGDFSGLVLALHELCTNSFKYGALGADTGRVELVWNSGSRCELHWIETGVEIGPATDGFGSRLIRGALAKIGGASVNYRRQAGEVRCEFVWPAVATG